MIGVGAIRKQHEHTPLSEFGQFGDVGGPPIHGGVI